MNSLERITYDCTHDHFNCERVLELRGRSISKFKGYNNCLTKIDLSFNSGIIFEGDCPHLRELSICDSELKMFQPPFTLRNLRSLDLRCNLFREFHGNFPHLKELSLAYCYIESFSGEYPELVDLELQSNELKEFGGQFPKLKRLELEDNHIVKFGTNLEIPCLNILTLNDNPLEFISITSSPFHVSLYYTYVKFVDPHLDLESIKSDDDEIQHRGHSLGVLDLIAKLLPMPIAEEIEPHIEV